MAGKKEETLAHARKRRSDTFELFWAHKSIGWTYFPGLRAEIRSRMRNPAARQSSILQYGRCPGKGLGTAKPDLDLSFRHEAWKRRINNISGCKGDSGRRSGKVT